jgi:raffinose/stachyose/melibiose transport system permease protein
VTATSTAPPGAGGRHASVPPTTSAGRPRRRGSPPRRVAGAVARHTVAVVVLAVFALPLLLLAATAVKSPEEFTLSPVGLPHGLALGNFRQAWVQGDFRSFVLNSVLYTGACASLGTVLSLFVAFPIARGYVRWPRFWLGLFVVALFLPNALTTQFQLLLRLGLYDTRLGYLLLLLAPLGVGPLLITGYVRSIPRALDEAAAMDGASYVRFVVSFVAPLCRPVLVTVFVLQAIGVWNEIILATIVLADPAKLPVSAGLFAFSGQYSDEWTLLSAATLIVALPLVAVYVLLQRHFVAGALQGAFTSS